ncbi:MAG TPA: demethoxyubiquinone hydroxylase family protein [Stellaceae bacterium]|nr:demethoxyubiquinone hydroxylase family protein [Stellaceae bacterium]
MTAHRLPGDPSPEEEVARMIRVDHAGEYGAVRIYEGQLAVLGHTASGAVIREMADQERQHLERFQKLVQERHVRPTALSPLWHVAGFALGAASALLGARAAMACTVAVEEVIDEHYRQQAERLGTEEGALRATIEEFRDDELEHRDTGLAHGATEAPLHDLLTAAVKTGSRLAIWLSTRL